MEQQTQTMAIARGKDLSISPKYAFMICQHLRKKNTSEAKRALEAAIALVEPIPFTKFNDGVGHRKGNMAAGRFAVKACKAILMTIQSAEANAINKGMSSSLMLKELRANKATSPMKAGRQRHEAKRAHVYVTLVEDSRKPRVRTPAPKKNITTKKSESPAPKVSGSDGNSEAKATGAEEVKAKPAKKEVKAEEAPAKEESKAETKTEAKTEEKKE